MQIQGPDLPSRVGTSGNWKSLAPTLMAKITSINSDKNRRTNINDIAEPTLKNHQHQ